MAVPFPTKRSESSRRTPRCAPRLPPPPLPHESVARAECERKARVDGDESCGDAPRIAGCSDDSDPQLVHGLQRSTASCGQMRRPGCNSPAPPVKEREPCRSPPSPPPRSRVLLRRVREWLRGEAADRGCGGRGRRNRRRGRRGRRRRRRGRRRGSDHRDGGRRRGRGLDRRGHRPGQPWPRTNRAKPSAGSQNGVSGSSSVVEAGSAWGSVMAARPLLFHSRRTDVLQADRSLHRPDAMLHHVKRSLLGPGILALVAFAPPVRAQSPATSPWLPILPVGVGPVGVTAPQAADPAGGEANSPYDDLAAPAAAGPLGAGRRRRHGGRCRCPSVAAGPGRRRPGGQRAGRGRAAHPPAAVRARDARGGGSRAKTVRCRWPSEPCLSWATGGC